MKDRREYMRAYRLRNKNRFREADKIRWKKWYQLKGKNKLREYHKKYQRNYRLTHKYIKKRNNLRDRWYLMKRRCLNVRHPDYKFYGLKGIGISAQWLEFDNFSHDMRDGFEKHCAKYGIKNTTLDRINGKKGYNKENCRWATWKIQNENRVLTNHPLTFMGEKKTTADWARKLGGNPQTIRWRLANGWSLEKTLTTPIITNNKIS